MIQIGTPMAPHDGDYGYWIKRGDAAAQSKGDVQFAATKAELEQKKAEFSQRGISSYTISAHVPGDLIKF